MLLCEIIVRTCHKRHASRVTRKNGCSLTGASELFPGFKDHLVPGRNRAERIEKQLGLQYADEISDMDDLSPCVKARTAEQGMCWYELMFVQLLRFKVHSKPVAKFFSKRQTWGQPRRRPLLLSALLLKLPQSSRYTPRSF